ncbi:MAG: molybdenum cofactor guanylyltransferase, partial [Planctomycetota bacterium]|nr:molybdenum cofactor guanylyltransferase [Planctomycetota bacterium]
LPADVLIKRDRQSERGPLEGLAVGLEALRGSADAAFVSPCDCPLLRSEFVRKMISCLDDHELVIPRDASFFHPLAAVYRTSLVDRVTELIAANRMRPFFLVEAADSRIIDVSELRDVDPQLESLRNMNTPDDYESALKLAGFAR